MKRTGDQLRFDFETVKTAINRWRADHAPFLTRDEAVRHILGEWLDREGYIAKAVDLLAPHPEPKPYKVTPGHRAIDAPGPARVGGSGPAGVGHPVPRVDSPVRVPALEVGLVPPAQHTTAMPREDVGPRPSRQSLSPGAACLAGAVQARRDGRSGHPLSVPHPPRPLGEGRRPASHAPAP